MKLSLKLNLNTIYQRSNKSRTRVLIVYLCCVGCTLRATTRNLSLSNFLARARVSDKSLQRTEEAPSMKVYQTVENGLPSTAQSMEFTQRTEIQDLQRFFIYQDFIQRRRWFLWIGRYESVINFTMMASQMLFQRVSFHLQAFMIIFLLLALAKQNSPPI